MPNTPSQWLAVLHDRLEARRAYIDKCERYYDGRHNLAFATSRFRETFGSMFGAFADNWCQLVVDASVERLTVDGFRFGPDESSDTAAWELWQANELDAQSSFAHTDAGTCGESFGLVAPGQDGEPIITVEHPSQCIVAHAPGMRRRRLCGLKEWLEDDGYLRANVYLPDVIVKFRSVDKYRHGATLAWRPYDDGLGEAVQSHQMGVVPLVPFLNKPATLRGGRSDLDPVISKQDAINKLAADMMVASEFAAFRQRWATGIEIPRDDDGNPVTKQFLAAVSRAWVVEDEDAKFGEFDASDLGNYVKAIEMFVQHIAAQTRTPPHYLLGQSGAFPSGESLKSTETGLVAKVREKQRLFGESWEEIIRLAFRVRGDGVRASALNAETIWRDPESRTTGEQTDAAVKEMALGVPRELIWARRLGMSPQEIQRAKGMAAEEALMSALTQPEPVVPVTDAVAL